VKLHAVFALVLAAGCGGSSPSVSKPSSAALEPGSHRLSVGGLEVAFEVRGKGPVCFALPGGPGMDAAYLRTDALDRRFTMIYIDPLGTGSSSKLPPTERYSIARDAAVLEGLRTQLGLDRVCLVGHSYGGFVVQRYAVDHPKHVSGLLLYSTTPVTDLDWEKDVAANAQWFKDQPWFAEAARGIQAEAAAKDQGALAAALAREWPLYFADWSGHRAEYGPLIAQLTVSFDVYRRRVEREQFDVRQRLGVIHTTPTVIIAGERDFLCGVKPSTQLSNAIGGSKLVIIPQAGHYAHLEQPAAFEAAVESLATALRR
jgi:proline iminopeptidase